ncbi:MAG: hypothetical protein HRU32_13165 [Rhodobacteraceae bacterium]|nr:hypothetical protein [Paracoccaceae bacterium]
MFRTVLASTVLLGMTATAGLATPVEPMSSWGTLTRADGSSPTFGGDGIPTTPGALTSFNLSKLQFASG